MLKALHGRCVLEVAQEGTSAVPPLCINPAAAAAAAAGWENALMDRFI